MQIGPDVNIPDVNDAALETICVYIDRNSAVIAASPRLM